MDVDDDDFEQGSLSAVFVCEPESESENLRVIP